MGAGKEDRIHLAVVGKGWVSFAFKEWEITQPWCLHGNEG